jgi:crotonobetainyl-CoA:carnitine CoA-transferase CaiB-like acyl-CoA transferase
MTVTPHALPTTGKPLSGLWVAEVATFVAGPLGGMTLAQPGADVIRVDPPGGSTEYTRWPVAASGMSLYWTGRNRRHPVCTPSGDIDALLPPVELAGQKPVMGAVPVLGEHTEAIRAEFGTATRADTREDLPA